jgi:Uma2 family endonuclease
MAAQPDPIPQRYTLEEYLVLERLAEGKSEYLEGQIVPMTDHGPEHTAITANITISVGGQLRDTLCHTVASEIKIRTAPTELYAYPDLIVFCGEPRFHDHHRDILVNPTVLFEVYSPSTEAYDRGRKFACYQHIESLTDYVLIAQEEPRIEHFFRQTENTWLLTIATGREAEIPLDSIDAVLHLSDVYDRVSFTSPP